MNMKKDLFKRMNFFKGFFTQAGDWQQGQEYHARKQAFHNRFFHTPGIVFGCLDNLRVTSGKDGTTIHIAPGYAVDGEGRDLYLPVQERLKISPQEYRPPVTAFVVLQYHEEKIDLRPNEANPEYSDYAFVQEKPTVEITTREPDNHQVIELARIALSQNASSVGNPKSPGAPGPDEIDTTHAKRAGVALGPITLEDIGKLVKDGKINVVASKEPIPGEDDTNVLIEKIGAGDMHRFYHVSAYPTEEARIIWRIESNFKKDAVEYRLYFENFSKKDVNVFYRIYRLN